MSTQCENLKAKLKNTLTELKSSELHPTKKRNEAFKLVELVWSTIFALGVDNVQFTPEEKCELGPLLDVNLTKLDVYLSCLVDSFQPGLSEKSLYARSAVEFLLKNYRDFPSRKNNVKLEVRLGDLSQVVEDLTEAIGNWNSSPWGWGDFTGETPKEIPKEHVWWF